ncbi:MAG: 6-phosphofructokinase [Lapillicoccus sp.]
MLFDDTVELVRDFFETGATRVGIVTCGGLCPGLNDVIRGLVLELHAHYSVDDVIGFRHGFAGLVPGLTPAPSPSRPRTSRRSTSRAARSWAAPAALRTRR